MPDTMPNSPYDAQDMDAAVAYTKVTNQLFADGKTEEAFAHWKRDPLGGANAGFAHVTREIYVEHMYGLRDQQGNYLHPRPAGPLSEAVVKPPYNYNDMDAAVSYSQATGRLFAAGKIDEAFAHWKQDPNGGATLSFCGWTKEEFAEAWYNTRDVQGKYLYPRPTPVTESSDQQADDAGCDVDAPGMSP